MELIEEPMQERRILERFNLKLPAKIKVDPPTPHEPGHVQELETENISSGGAFFRTLTPLMKGTRVKIEVALNFLEHSIHHGNGSLVKLKGEVLHSNPNGMAVRFDRPYKILPQQI